MKFSAKNFQCWKKLEIIFNKGVNVIIGKSDKGKSAIIRALKLLFENKPSGEKYRRHNTKMTDVTGVIDKHTISRKRGKGKNIYIHEGDQLKAMGSDVPDLIKNILNMGPENIQSQHEFYFLIDKSPGKVAKSLNKVSDLSVMDTAMKKVKKDVHEASGLTKEMEEQIKIKNKTVQNLFWVDEAEKDLNDQLELDKLITKVHKEYTRISEVIESLIKLQTEEVIPEGMEDEFVYLESLIQLKHDSEKNTITLEGVLKKTIQARTELDESVDLDSESLAVIQKYINKIQSFEVNKEVIKQLLDKIQTQEMTVAKIVAEEDVLKDALDSVENCPYCGSDT